MSQSNAYAEYTWLVLGYVPLNPFSIKHEFRGLFKIAVVPFALFTRYF